MHGPPVAVVVVRWFHFFATTSWRVPGVGVFFQAANLFPWTGE